MANRPSNLSVLDGISVTESAHSLVFAGKAKYGIPSTIRSTPMRLMIKAIDPFDLL